jgi:12,18-didecarboxysiroheme deacetylase
MIGISKLYVGTVSPSDALRYERKGKRMPSHLLQFSEDKPPVVVWNATRRCNLACVHCYSQSDATCTDHEMSTQEGRALIDDLAEFGAPVILFSGGEPLVRKDVPELAAYAREKGMRAVLSTNGTLIDEEMAARLKEIGLSYVGVSLDGMRETHDYFRGREGAFDDALAGIRATREAGIKVGLRYTITRHNVQDVDGVFDLIEREDIPRACFYHLAYSGRGSEMVSEDLSPAETRRIVDRIIDRTAELHRKGTPREVLTVANHVDGPYLYLRMLREGNPRAEQVMELLRMNGGNSTGVGIGAVSWDGTVYPDQFWRNRPLGNVRERPFSGIWTDRSNEFLMKLKHKKEHVKGRCAACRFLDVCGGNLRERAEAVTGDPWEAEPTCYLTNEEIGLEEPARAEVTDGV